MGGRRTWSSEIRRFVERQLSEGIWSNDSAYERERVLIRVGKDLQAVGIPRRPASISVDDIRKYITWLSNSKRTASTQRRHLLLLTDFLMKEADNMSGMKLRRQFPPETQTDTPRPPYEELVKGFDRLSGIEDPWQRAIARGQAAVFIGTMVRPSEGRRAIYADLDRKAWKLRIRHPKGKTREREVEFLDARCITEMKLYLQERAETLQYLEEDPNDPNLPLFPSINVKQRQAGGKATITIYSKGGFSRLWALAFPGMVHYCARRGMAQYLVDKDIKVLPAVSKVLGHANINTTMQYYSKVRMDKACAELRGILQNRPEAPAGPKDPLNQAVSPLRFKPNTDDPMFS